MFTNYLKESDRYINLFNTALESFNSLMQKLEMWSENPYKMPILEIDFMNNKGYFNYEGFEKAKDKHQQGQQRTGKWLIIQKIK